MGTFDYVILQQKERPMRRPRPLKLTVIAAVLLVLALSVAACSPATDPADPPSPSPTTTPAPGPGPDEPEEELSLSVYLVRDERLGVAQRQVPRTVAVARAALEELLSGPTARDAEAGLATEIPEGTRLLDVDVRDGVATVDLSEEFESGGGTLSMQLRVAQVVFTLTQFDSVGNVAFMIEGRQVEAIGGEGIVVSPPVDRLDLADNTSPAILVESPAPWEEVRSPLRITGMSNTFEATLLYEVVDPSGAIVDSGFATATAGTGTWGTFDFTVSYDIARAGQGALILFESSARDGSRINEVEIPLLMLRRG
jgi:hypothetical protein